jgi:signal transduction histidine kinase
VREYSAEVYDEGLGGAFDLRISPLRGEGGRLLGSVHVARDITAFKSMERARRLAVHHLSHELKTPLAIIKGSVKDLERDDVPAPAKASKVERIRRSLERLSDIQHIVQEIVEPRTYSPRPFEVLKELHRILGEIRQASAHRAVEVIPRGEEISTDIIDPEVFEDVVRTLVKNAIENTPDEGEVEVSLSRAPAGVLLQVKDRGVGVPASDKDFLFEAFHHTQETERYATKNPFDFDAGGKGLELMRLKILSEAGGFRISFQSRRCSYLQADLDRCPGKISACTHPASREDCRESGGTTFSVLFPG